MTTTSLDTRPARPLTPYRATVAYRFNGVGYAAIPGVGDAPFRASQLPIGFSMDDIKTGDPILVKAIVTPAGVSIEEVHLLPTSEPKTKVRRRRTKAELQRAREIRQKRRDALEFGRRRLAFNRTRLGKFLIAVGLRKRSIIKRRSKPATRRAA